jgi:hypothetical protein
MRELVFICPVVGTDVYTGVGMDVLTLESLKWGTIYCPRCHETHEMAGLVYWLSEPDQPRDDDVKAA